MARLILERMEERKGPLNVMDQKAGSARRAVFRILIKKRSNKNFAVSYFIDHFERNIKKLLKRRLYKFGFPSQNFEEATLKIKNKGVAPLCLLKIYKAE